MARITTVTCDSCRTDITGKGYTTLSLRVYKGANHEKVLRMPALWLCDKCYRKMAMYMAFPPFDQEDMNEQIH